MLCKKLLDETRSLGCENHYACSCCNFTLNFFLLCISQKQFKTELEGKAQGLSESFPINFSGSRRESDVYTNFQIGKILIPEVCISSGPTVSINIDTREGFSKQKWEILQKLDNKFSFSDYYSIMNDISKLPWRSKIRSCRIHRTMSHGTERVFSTTVHSLLFCWQTVLTILHKILGDTQVWETALLTMKFSLC